MNRILTAMCLIMSLTGCFEESYKTPAKHQFNRVPQSQKPRFRECKKPLTIAVIDTGFGSDNSWTGQETAHLCKFGHKDFTNGETSTRFNTKDEVPVDNHGHGTHIAGIIDAYAKQTNNSYCLVILKYYDPKAAENFNLQRTVEAIKYAKRIGVDIINYSGGGISKSEEETKAVKTFIDAGGTFVAAAGNEGSNMDYFHFYPAQEDDRVIAVGNGTDKHHRAPTSNYGNRVNRWEDGTNVLVYNHYMTGTSQSAAIVTGKLIAEKNKSCK